MTVLVSLIVGLGLFFIIGLAARAALRAAAPARHRPMFRDMPLTAAFGLAVILAYVVVAILAPVIAPFGEGEVLGDQYLPWAARWPLLQARSLASGRHWRAAGLTRGCRALSMR